LVTNSIYFKIRKKKIQVQDGGHLENDFQRHYEHHKGTSLLSSSLALSSSLPLSSSQLSSSLPLSASATTV